MMFCELFFLYLGFAYMTKQLMNLADGKVVLVLEGGYELNALAECGKLCVKALLDRPVKQNKMLLFVQFLFCYLDTSIQ
jgi:acetoin utilization deacetylase AcuC-like enzyme